MHLNIPVIVLLFGSILWGLSWIPLKYFNQQGIAGIPLTFIAYGVVGLLLLPIIIKQYSLWKKNQRYIWLVFILGGIANLAFAVSMVYGDVIRVMVLFYLLPAWGVLGGKIFLNEHIDRTRWIAVGLALTGAFIVLGGFTLFNTPPTWIDLLALLSGFALSMNNIAFRASTHLPVETKIGMQFVGTFFLAAVLLLFQVQTIPVISYDILGLIIVFGIFGLLVATIATQWAVTKLEVGRASILIIFELVTAVISAMWINNEQLSLMETIGGLMIIAAALLEAFRSSDTHLACESSEGRKN